MADFVSLSRNPFSPSKAVLSLEQWWGKPGCLWLEKACEEPAKGGAPTWEKWVRSMGVLWERGDSCVQEGRCFLALGQRGGLAFGDPAGFWELSEPQGPEFWRSC